MKPGSHTKLGSRERQIMEVVYRLGRATVAEVLAQLEDPPSYSAVRATLNVLVEKGQATYRQDGPRYVYLPTTPAEKARTAAVRHLINTFFNGSTEQAMAALVEMSDAKMPRETLERLTRKVSTARKEGR